MTFWKVLANCAGLSVSANILWMHYESHISRVYSLAFVVLHAIDLLICILIFIKLSRPKGQQVRVKGITGIYWFLILQVIFYVFVSCSFFMNLTIFVQIFQNNKMIEIMLISMLAYSGIAIFHILSSCLFKKRQNRKYQI